MCLAQKCSKNYLYQGLNLTELLLQSQIHELLPHCLDPTGKIIYFPEQMFSTYISNFVCVTCFLVPCPLVSTLKPTCRCWSRQQIFYMTCWKNLLELWKKVNTSFIHWFGSNVCTLACLNPSPFPEGINLQKERKRNTTWGSWLLFLLTQAKLSTHLFDVFFPMSY